MTTQQPDTGAQPAPRPDDRIERMWRESPESKLELIDGRLIVGNSLAGSRLPPVVDPAEFRTNQPWGYLPRHTSCKGL